MPENIEIRATIYKATFDKDGEAKLILCIPQLNAPEVAALALNTDKVFVVEFKPQL